MAFFIIARNVASFTTAGSPFCTLNFINRRRGILKYSVSEICLASWRGSFFSVSRLLFVGIYCFCFCFMVWYLVSVSLQQHAILCNKVKHSLKFTFSTDCAIHITHCTLGVHVSVYLFMRNRHTISVTR